MKIAGVPGWHAHRGGAHVGQHLGDGGGGAAHLQALEVFHLGDGLVLGEDDAGAMHMDGQQLDVLVLVGSMLLHEVPGGTAGRLGIGHGERQLEHLGTREAARGVARRRPDHVGHAVLGLVEQLRRSAAELHGREDLALQASLGVLLDVLAPVTHHGGVLDRLRAQEVMHLDGDGLVLGLGCESHAGNAGGQHGALENMIHWNASKIKECIVTLPLIQIKHHRGFPLKTP